MLNYENHIRFTDGPALLGRANAAAIKLGGKFNPQLLFPCVMGAAPKPPVRREGARPPHTTCVQEDKTFVILFSGSSDDGGGE